MEAIICDEISSYKAIYVVSFLVNTIKHNALLQPIQLCKYMFKWM